jgi:hypothetical protein
MLKVISLVFLASTPIAAYSGVNSFEEDEKLFSSCIAENHPNGVIAKLRVNTTSVEARTDDSQITKEQRNALKFAAKTWEKCLSSLTSPSYTLLARVGLDPLVDGANGKYKVWKDFYSAQNLAYDNLRTAVANFEAEQKAKQAAEQEQQNRKAAMEAILQSNKDDAERQAEAQRRLLEIQERMARDNAINNGLNNLIQSMQPRPITPMFAPQMNCNSRATGFGNVQTNCW